MEYLVEELGDVNGGRNIRSGGKVAEKRTLVRILKCSTAIKL